MNFAIYDENGGYFLFTNQGLQVGDHVFPFTQGYSDGTTYYVTGIRTENHLSGWPDDPHIILDLEYNDDKPYQVHTSKGYGPIESYFRLIE